MMQHYVEIKDQYPHALLLYRVGDFYEVFQDACTVSEQLELVLTSIQGGKEIGRVPMSGFRTMRSTDTATCGEYAIAICDQVEDASVAAAQSRQVRREVTRSDAWNVAG